MIYAAWSQNGLQVKLDKKNWIKILRNQIGQNPEVKLYITELL
jgi:hypothetical protein